MKNDYLWDKSGEPDKEVERLEDLLSAFSHQPQQLVIPPAQEAPRGGSGLPKWIGVAAAAVLVISLGMWFGLRPRKVEIAFIPVPPERKEPQVTIPQINPPAVQRKDVDVPEGVEVVRNDAAVISAQRRAAERRGRIARDKVLFALQVTSSKIQLIDRKIEADLN